MPKKKNDQSKTTKELIRELEELREQVVEIEETDRNRKRSEEKRIDITVRKQSEEALQESEERFRSFSAASFDGIVVLEGGKLLDVNDQFLSICGYSREELYGMRVDTLVHPEDKEFVRDHIRSGYELPYEHRLVHKDGRIIHLEVRGKQIQYKDKQCRITAIRDITEHKQTERELLLKNIVFETSIVAYSTADLKGIINQANDSFVHMWGYKRKSEVIGKPILHFIQNVKNAEVIISSLNKTGKWVGEYTAIRKDGSTFIAKANATILNDETDQKVGYQSSVQDITERKKAEQALGEREEELSLIYDSVGDVLYFLGVEPDDCFRFLSINQMFLKVTGLAKDLVVGKRIEEVIPKPSIFMVRDNYKKAIRENKTIRWEETSTYPAGEKVGRVSITPVLNEKGICKRLVGSVHDITDQKQIEEQLRQALKMEAIGTLAGGIAHDFNNMLSVIMGFTDMSIDELPADSNVRENLIQVMKSSERAKEMVQQILTFSRKSQETMSIVNTGKIIKETVKFLRSSIPTTIEIKTNVSKDPGLVFANATQINQVLMNLCTNAMHAMREDGGVLEIRLSQTDMERESLKGKDLEPGWYQQLTITDTGCGMSKELAARIFEPYFTTMANGEGTGMGLAVAHGIVKSHGGNITVYSEPGRGSTFNVFLPVMEGGEEEVSKPRIDYEAVVTGGNERILLVDDELSLVEIGKQMLEHLGYEVTSRNSSVEALEAFESNFDKFDLLVTDMTMPNMTGVKLAREIHKIRPGFPVIICTGFSERINRENYLQQGISGFVMKPMMIRDIAQVIREVLDGKRE
jgi:PAS domain S-box-containing protein